MHHVPTPSLTNPFSLPTQMSMGPELSKSVVRTCKAERPPPPPLQHPHLYVLHHARGPKMPAVCIIMRVCPKLCPPRPLLPPPDRLSLQSTAVLSNPLQKLIPLQPYSLLPHSAEFLHPIPTISKYNGEVLQPAATATDLSKPPQPPPTSAHLSKPFCPIGTLSAPPSTSLSKPPQPIATVL